MTHRKFIGADLRMNTCERVKAAALGRREKLGCDAITTKALAAPIEVTWPFRVVLRRLGLYTPSRDQYLVAAYPTEGPWPWAKQFFPAEGSFWRGAESEDCLRRLLATTLPATGEMHSSVLKGDLGGTVWYSVQVKIGDILFLGLPCT